MSNSQAHHTGFEIAIIGMSCRVPGADNIYQFWDNLVNGRESISFFSKEELSDEGINPEVINNSSFIRAKGIINKAEYFDPFFFGFTQQEAQNMDPQLRVFLECAWEVLEDGGYANQKIKSNIGIYASAADNFEWRIRTNLINKLNNTYQFYSLENKDFLSTLTAYKLGLKGAAVSIYTACSSSLVAIHQACQALLAGECDVAMAGGVAISVPVKNGYLYSTDFLNSPDGHCRSFDDEESGLVMSDGVGIVLLKTLEDAIRNKDVIHAVIKGSAVNNDGNFKVGFEAPSSKGQAEVIKRAILASEVLEESIGYIETHGTATRVGDPIEIEGLKQVFKHHTGVCRLGSVKSNIGHLDVAAGVIGLIKTVLSIKNKQIPPILHFSNLNQQIDLGEGPFVINDKLVQWPESNYPLRAGVSSFGQGGTNAHVIIEEAPNNTFNSQSDRDNIFLVSGKTQYSLVENSRRLSGFLKRRPELSPSNVAYTLMVGRAHLEYRQMIVSNSLDSLIDKLENPESRNISRSVVSLNVKRNIIFVFSGIGSQYVDMGRGLYQNLPLFKKSMDECFQIIKEQFDIDLKKTVFPDPVSNEIQLSHLKSEHLILFIIQYSLCMQLEELGIKPDYIVGYSFGEFAAACCAGVFSLNDALKIVYHRNELLKSLPEGRMISVPFNREELKEIMANSKIEIAIDNGDSVILSGLKKDVEILEKTLKENKVLYFPLDSTIPIHTSLAEPVLSSFSEILETIKFNEIKTSYLSGIQAKWLKDDDLCSGRYWLDHINQTVNFSSCASQLNSIENSIFIEIGPGGETITLLKQLQKEKLNHSYINLIKPSSIKDVPDYTYYLKKIGQIWLAGKDFDFEKVNFKENVQRISLPTYAFDRQKYWQIIEEYNKNPLWKKWQNKDHQVSIEGRNSYYLINWVRQNNFSNKKISSDIYKKKWLLFSDDEGFVDKLINKIPLNDFIFVRSGMKLESKEKNNYSLDYTDEGQYIKLFDLLKDKNWIPEKIIDARCLCFSNDCNEINKSIERYFFNFLHLLKSVTRAFSETIETVVLTNEAHNVLGNEEIQYGTSLAVGPSIAVSQEFNNIQIKNIDIQVHEKNDIAVVAESPVLLNELLSPSKEKLIAIRNEHKWFQKYLPTSLSEKEGSFSLQKNGVYIIIGGLGDIGFAFARYLAETVQATLIIVGKINFKNSHESTGEKLKKSNRLNELRNLTVVDYYSINILHSEALKDLIVEVEKKYLLINGIIHSAGTVKNEYFLPLHEIDHLNSRYHFEPKVYGLVNLYESIKYKNIDFVLLVSSIASQLAGLGLITYSAAHNFMDTFANSANKESETPWIVLNWDGSDSEDVKKVSEKVFSNGITSQVLYSKHEDLNILKSKWVDLYPSKPESATAIIQYMERPLLTTDYLEPRSGVEKKIADIWQSFFGINQIGINDDFIELGGDSLKAVRLLQIMHKQTGKMVSLKEFFTSPNIKAISKSLNRKDTTDFKPLKKNELKEYYVASSSQKRLFVLQQMEIGNVFYNMPYFFTIKRSISLEELEGVFNILVNRHESLRTYFKNIDDQIVQVIEEGVNFSSSLYRDIKTGEDISGALHEFIKPFNLESLPLFRYGMLCNDQEYVILFDMHHIITDGISSEILVEEFVKILDGCALTDLKVTYKDYAIWQNYRRVSVTIKKQEEYWINCFKEGIPVLNLPTDFPRPNVQSYEGKKHVKEFKPPFREKIEDLGKNIKATNFMMLLSCYFTLLAKMSGQKEIVVGLPLAGRNHQELGSVIGLFVNTIALKVNIEPTLLFSQFLAKVKEEVMKAFDNQDFQFEELVKKLNVERDMSRNPLFDVMFVYQNFEEEFYKTKNPNEKVVDRIVTSPYNDDKAKFDLTFEFREQLNKLILNVEYSTKLFKDETVSRFIGYYERIIDTVLKNPDIRLADIDILPESDKKLILHKFNNTSRDYPKEKTIHGQIEESVLKYPNKIAVFHDDIFLTYSELNKYSNRLVNILKLHGVCTGSVVGLLVERSIDMIISIFGILKAGAAYLPIHPEYPQKRVDYIIKDSNIDILITQEKFRDIKFKKKKIVFDLLQINKFSSEYHHDEICSSCNIAYLIYTSGSTGLPKGSAIEHHSVINRLCWMQNAYPIGTRDIVLQKTTFIFDVSVWEILWWAFHGAKLCLLESGAEKEPKKIFTTISRMNITTLHFVPRMFNEFLSVLNEEVNYKKLDSLKYIFVSGEVLNSSDVNKFNKTIAKTSKTKLVNLYGPTEATIDVSFYTCKRGDYVSKIPIGKPIDNINLVILDNDLNLLPIGIIGELCISGVGLSRGYINNVNPTHEKFVRDPFAINKILYKTGDLAKWLPDGNIEFIGRKDNQIKINGHRIELEEIKHLLLKHEKLSDAVVLTYNFNNKIQIISFFVSEIKIDEADLKNYLRNYLPHYMIPSVIQQVKEIPFTLNGKVDTKSIIGDISFSQNKFELPKTQLEKEVTELWKVIFKKSDISVNDNFFRLGGDSIIAIQFLARLKDKNLKLDFKDIFNYPTIRTLIPFIKQEDKKINHGAIHGEVSLIPIQRHFFEQNKNKIHHYNHAIMLKLHDKIDILMIQKAFSILSEHHDMLRTSFIKTDGQIKQIVSKKSQMIDVKVYDIRNDENQKEKVIEFASNLQAEMNIFLEPLIKLGFFKLSKENCLLVIIHHLITDGISWRIIMEDLNTIFTCLLEGTNIKLPSKTDSYKLWAEALIQYSNSSEMLKEIDYWRESLKGQAGRIEINESGSNTYKDISRQSLEFTTEKTNLLKTKVNHVFNININEAILTAIGVAIQSVWKCEDVLIAMEGHGRQNILKNIDTNRTIGWFTSIYPVYLNLSYSYDLKRQLIETKEIIRRIPNNGLGYGILKYLTNTEYLSSVTLEYKPQLCFNYFGQVLNTNEKGVLSISDFPVGNSYDSDLNRTFEIEVEAIIVKDKLSIYINYSDKRFDYYDINKFKTCISDTINKIIDLSKQETEQYLSPSDLTFKDISVNDLENFFEQ